MPAKLTKSYADILLASAASPIGCEERLSSLMDMQSGLASKPIKTSVASALLASARAIIKLENYLQQLMGMRD